MAKKGMNNEQRATAAFEKNNANVAKHKLIEILDRLQAAGCVSDAVQLEKIIIKLEVWQNS